METIHSFTIDHDEHGEGFYLSNTMDDILTYDLRFVYPNSGDYLPSPVMHTIEHLFATVVRNSEKAKDVVYFGPMGCRTGFYLLMKNTPYADALRLTKNCIKICLEQDSVPGAERKQCGNYLEHDLEGAKLALTKYLVILEKIA